MYWNRTLIINFDSNIIKIEITKYRHSTELSCNITTLPVGLSDTQMGVCRVYVFMYGLRRLSRVEVQTRSVTAIILLVTVRSTVLNIVVVNIDYLGSRQYIDTKS